MAYKMKGSPAKLGAIQGTTGHSSALKQKQQSSGKDNISEMQTSDLGKKLKALKQIKAEQDFMGKKNWTENELIKMGPEKRKKIMDALKKHTSNTSPAKQEGPTPEKNPDLMKGEMEGTAVYEGKDNRERIVDLEDRAGFLSENDIPDLEGSKDPKDIERVKQLKATVKKLQNEANILRNRKPNKK